jgi:hypothetical protein
VVEGHLEVKESNKIQNFYADDLKQQNEHLLDLVGATYVRTHKKTNAHVIKTYPFTK